MPGIDKELLEKINNNQVSRLDLRLKFITDISQLANALEKNTSVTYLDLGWNSIGDTGIAQLMSALRRNSTLVDLTLDKISLTDRGIREIAQTLNYNHSLKKLNLAENEGVTDVGFNELAKTLETNNSLEKLILYGNNTSTLFITELVRILPLNKSLRVLHLARNRIGDNSAICLAESLNNTNLRWLDLTGTEISHIAAKKFAEALKNNRSLNRLILKDNNIGKTGASAFLEILSENYTLDTLEIDSAYKLEVQLGERFFSEINFGKILKEKDPTKRANMLRDLTASSPVPSLVRLCMFAVKDKSIEELKRLPVELCQTIISTYQRIN